MSKKPKENRTVISTYIKVETAMELMKRAKKTKSKSRSSYISELLDKEVAKKTPEETTKEE